MSDAQDGQAQDGKSKEGLPQDTPAQDSPAQDSQTQDSELSESELEAWGLGANAAATGEPARGAVSASGSADPPREPVPEALLDIELEATLRFGSREMTLGEVLDLGPGDVIELDRQVNDAVDLLVGDKIVARGHAVLSNGKYGIRVSEVAELKWSLESVRCLF